MRRTRALLFGVLMAVASTTPAQAAPQEVVATLDGRQMPISEIPDYACQDLDFPIIRCFRTVSDRDASVSTQDGQLQAAVAAGVVYVTIWDGANFIGSSLSISQDYDALSLIGWNDRVSSFKGRNAETGRFYVDWFQGGGFWNFCCNQQTGSLGGFNNTFSSVYRT